MLKDYHYFIRRYLTVEKEFLELSDYIEITPNFEDHCYKIGSSKLMDFCLKIGTDIETLIKKILKSHLFEGVDNIDNIKLERDGFKNMRVYRVALMEKYDLHTFNLFIPRLERSIIPFEEFEHDKNPEWFKTFSRDKHDKITLIKSWTMKDSLLSLGGLLIFTIINIHAEKVGIPSKFIEDLNQGLFYIPEGGYSEVKDVFHNAESDFKLKKDWGLV